MAHGTTGNLYDVPIKVLSTKTSKQICDSLNTLMILPAENGLLRDWRGLSELLRVDVSVLERQQNPTQKLLQLAQDDEQKNTIEVLILSLEALNRYDIIDDYQELIDNDVRQYNSIQNSIATSIPPVCQNETYDAMVLYAEADVDFACNLVNVMETNYHLKLFVKERNLRAGDKEVQATLSVIADSSNKLVVILSPDFITSATNEFFLDYAQTIAIEQRIRKIIPCILTRCQIPKQLLGLHTLTYTSNSRWGCFWSRLAESIDSYAVTKQTVTANTRSLESSVSNIASPEERPENKQQNNSSQLLAKSPPVSNNNSQSQKLTPQLKNTASVSPSTSLSTQDGYDLASFELRKKSHTKKMTSFLNNVKKKLLPKRDKKKSSDKKKKKIAVAL